ncbi:CAP domain-containing protein [Cubamyces menziesii]|nr:CAP domain-containing protein [Cubamyces menziesii]
MKLSLGHVAVVLAFVSVAAARPAVFHELVASPSPTDPASASSPSATQDSALATPSTPPVGSSSSPVTVPTSPPVSSDSSETSSSSSASSASLDSQSTSATSISDAPTGVSSVVPSASSSPSDTIPTNTGSVSPVTPTSDHSSTTPAGVSNPSTDSGVPSSATGTGSIVTRASSSSDAPSPSSSPITDDQAYLDLHNIVRNLVNAPPLTWSDDLASKAQSYAARCKLKHSDGANGPVGENLVAATGAFDVNSAVKLFVQDASQFHTVPFTFSHFTQVIWKSTTQLGCGSALCDNIFPDQDGKATYHVCLYDPVGNVVGQEK